MDSKEFIIKAAAKAYLVNDPEQFEEIIKAAKEQLNEADKKPFDENGKPRVLHLLAWMVHEGRNDNGHVFVKEELQARVAEGLFAPPHAGMIDFNHDFDPRGLWYKTVFAFDEAAQKWGILAHGAVWAWRFSELADKILAMMFEEGKIDVSMSALSESLEIKMDHPGFEGELSVVLHNPIFLTTSILDVPPGDEFGRGVASTKKTPEELQIASKKSEEDNKMETLEILQEKLTAAIKEKVELENKVNSLEIELETAKKSFSDKEVELKTSKEEVVKIKAEKSELEVVLSALKEQKATIEQSLAEVSGKLGEFETKETQRISDEKLQSRLAELSEVVRKNLDSHPEKDTMLTSWKTLDDAGWNKVKTTMSLSNSELSFTDRSRKEGALFSVSTTEDGSGLLKFLK